MEVHKNLNLENINGEIWREIEGFECYQISNLGRLKSLKCRKGKIIKLNKDKDGYLRIILSYKNNYKTKFIHTLMFESFIEEIPKGYIVHHIDFTKDNNILDNLQLMTRGKHNIEHKIGTKRPGEKSGHHTLIEQNVIQIRIFLKEGILTQKEIGEKFGVCRQTISQIKNNKIWKHVIGD